MSSPGVPRLVHQGRRCRARIQSSAPPATGSPPIPSITRPVLSVLLLALAGCAHAPVAAPTAYAVAATWPVAGAGGWDLLALDAPRHHLLLSRSDRMQVVDTRDGRLVGELAGTDRVHGIAIVPASSHGFTTNGHADTLTEFDLATLQRVRDIPISGQSPDAVLYDAFSGQLFVFNARSNNASVVDPASGREVAVIAFGGNPELAASDGKGRIFVNIEDKAQLVAINTRLRKIAATWALPGCEEPSGLALDIAHARLFSVCRNGTMVVTDAGSGAHVASVPIGEGPDGVVFDADRGLVFSPNGKTGTLTVVREDTPDGYHVMQTLATQSSARTVAIDPATHRLYLPAARFDPKPAGATGRPPMVPGSFSVLVVAPSVGDHQ